MYGPTAAHTRLLTNNNNAVGSRVDGNKLARVNGIKKPHIRLPCINQLPYQYWIEPIYLKLANVI